MALVRGVSCFGQDGMTLVRSASCFGQDGMALVRSVSISGHGITLVRGVLSAHNFIRLVKVCRTPDMMP